MFYNCKSLTNTPNLPSTNIPIDAYLFMFRDCYSLVDVPYLLPGIVVDTDGYYGMFLNCKALTNIPNIAATKFLGNSNCSFMFGSCESLIDARIDLLPLDLVDSCYSSMFTQCINLTYGPTIHAKSITNKLKDSCRTMFYNCQKLETLEVNFTEWDIGNTF